MTDLEHTTIIHPSPPSSHPEYRKHRRQNQHPFNFELDDERRQQLRDVAKARAMSMAATLRQLVSTAYAMHCAGAPHCVDGRACFMPHLHMPTRPPQPTHADTP